MTACFSSTCFSPSPFPYSFVQENLRFRWNVRDDVPLEGLEDLVEKIEVHALDDAQIHVIKDFALHLETLQFPSGDSEQPMRAIEIIVQHEVSHDQRGEEPLQHLLAVSERLGLRSPRCRHLTVRRCGGGRAWREAGDVRRRSAARVRRGMSRGTRGPAGGARRGQ